MGVEGEFVRCFVDGRLCSVWVGSGGVVYLSDGFAASLAESESRGFFDGVDGVARPSQRPGRFNGGVVAWFGVVPEADLGR